MSLGFPNKQGPLIKQNLTFLLKSLVNECRLHGPQMRTLWRKTPSSRALLNISFRVPTKRALLVPLAEFPLREMLHFQRPLCPSLKVPGKGAPSRFPDRAPIKKDALFQGLPLHILQIPLIQLPQRERDAPLPQPSFIYFSEFPVNEPPSRFL